MGSMVLRQNVPYLVKCDLCGHVSHNIYQVSFDGVKYKFCSGMHAEQARNNFNKNKELNVKPSIKLEEFEPDGGTHLGLGE